MLQYNENALRMGIDSTMVQTHTEAQDRCQFTHPTETPLFAVGPPATSEFNSIPPSPSFPAENQVSYDHRFDSRERRANSVIPIEYVLINEQLHKVRTFQVPPGQDYRRSFTPPASIPLAREATLVEPTLARPRVTSPLSEHNRFTPKPSHTGDTDQSIERSLGIAHDQFHSLPRQPLLAPVGHISTQEPEVKHGWPVHELISDVQQSGIQKGSAFSQINSSSTDTLTKSVSPPLLSSTPPSKASGERGFEDTIRESDNYVNTVPQNDDPRKFPKRPGSGSKMSRLKKPLIRTRSKRLARDLSWTVKRNKLNKAIYEHKENKTIECTKKLELDVGHGSGNPKLSVILHPYGLEGDKRRHVTLEVHIDVSKKAPKLSSGAMIRFSVSASDTGENRQLIEVSVEKDVLLREFYVYEFISHEALKESRSETIEIKAYVEYLPVLCL